MRLVVGRRPRQDQGISLKLFLLPVLDSLEFGWQFTKIAGGGQASQRF
jgi:hypothetical protein